MWNGHCRRGMWHEIKPKDSEEQPVSPRDKQEMDFHFHTPTTDKNVQHAEGSWKSFAALMKEWLWRSILISQFALKDGQIEKEGSAGGVMWRYDLICLLFVEADYTNHTQSLLKSKAAHSHCRHCNHFKLVWTFHSAPYSHSKESTGTVHCVLRMLHHKWTTSFIKVCQDIFPAFKIGISCI